MGTTAVAPAPSVPSSAWTYCVPTTPCTSDDLGRDAAHGRVRVEREHGQQAVDRGLRAGVAVDGAVLGDAVDRDAGRAGRNRAVRRVGAEEPGGGHAGRAARPLRRGGPAGQGDQVLHAGVDTVRDLGAVGRGTARGRCPGRRR